MDFCKRMGINIREEMQIDSLDQETRTKLYNATIDRINTWQNHAKNHFLQRDLSLIIANSMGEKLAKDEYKSIEVLESFFEEAPWYDIYTFLEIIYNDIYPSNIIFDDDVPFCEEFMNYIDTINEILEIERCNYRMGSDGKFIKCCCDEEFDNINQALNTDINPVKTHLEKAVKAYSARGEKINNTEVCNEAIKAVEALVRKKSGDKYKTKPLGQCLDSFRQKLNIPSFVINTIEKIWVALNSPETGVRHAGREDGSIIGEPEAYFILITCCSFINYVDKKVL